MPIWISDFVLGNVGTGAVVGVPGHDMRDFEFAREFKIPIIRVVVGKDGDRSEITRPEQVQEEEGIMANSGFLDGMEIHKAISAMMDYLEKKGWGKRVTTYKLRDWCISRQRYWGAPIPMVYCVSCAHSGLGWLSPESPRLPRSPREKDSMPGWFPVPEDQLPVLLPADVKDWKPEGTGKGPLAKIESFVNVECPNCGGKAERETDVCDTFLDSSWYHMRYPSVSSPKSPKLPRSLKEKDNEESELPWDSQITRKWLPVTQYIGGAEHTVLHLLYARFVAMAMKDFGYIDFDEPYTRFYAHGLIIAEGAKMSKSRGNVIIPDEYIKAYGADTLRTYLMFLGPFDMGGDFRDTGIAGMYRFLNRVWRLVLESLSPRSPKLPRSLRRNNNLERFMHRTIKEVTEDLENLRYNTAIAHIMEYVNYLSDNLQLTTDNLQLTKEAIKTLLLLLAPFAPHMTEELYQKLKAQSSKLKADQLDQFDSIHRTAWPTYDPQYLVEDEVTIVVQVNGKTRETIRVKSQKSKVKSEVEKIAMISPKIVRYLSSQSPRKVIFVPGKLINFVVYS
jgi:leucyl-tRNA synthetase